MTRSPGATDAAPASAQLFSGLSTADARLRLRQAGPNEPARSRRTTLVSALWSALGQPLVLILLAAAAVSGLLGNPVNALVISLLVLLSVSVDVSQSWRSARSAELLRAQVAPTARVRRDGAWTTVPRREVVPGDLIRLDPGDLVPADARLLRARDLHVQEAALTGESMPVEKGPVEEGPAEQGPAGTASVFLGTAVVSGHAEALVTATGAATAFGDVAARLASAPGETEFQRGARSFGVLILKTVLLLVLFVFVVSAARARPPLESLLFAVALAVGLTPEFLPMITSVTLSVGALRLSRQKVIVKRLAAIQNLGSMDVLCSDKTGTLTRGEMKVTAQLDLAGQPSPRVLLLAYLNSLFESGVADPVSEAVLQQAHLNPLDAAILHAEHPDVRGYLKLAEVPFDFERRRQSVAVRRGAETLLLVKGAPEQVLEVCQGAEEGDQVVPLDGVRRGQIAALLERCGDRGERVVAVAWRTLPERPSYGVQDEQGLTLAGFLSFSDPPHGDVQGVLEQLGRLGVAVKVISGDDPRVARHVCAQVGLDVTEVALGQDIDRLDEAALGALADRVSVFARVSPAQKERLIRALRARGHVVGYLGDGINDAPSLRAADIGVSVAGATDVARDAADIILLEHHLSVLLGGILEGRRALANIMKYLLMGTSSNFGNMFSMAFAALLLPFLPMLPTQILVNNFLYDLAQLPIPADRVDEGFTARPRRWDIGLVRRFMLLVGPISSLYDFLTFGALLYVFQADEVTFHTGWFVESLATQTLVIFVIRQLGGRSAPSRALVLSVAGVLLVGFGLPYTPLGALLGFAPLPAAYWAYVAAATLTYLALVAWLKHLILNRQLLGPAAAGSPPGSAVAAP